MEDGSLVTIGAAIVIVFGLFMLGRQLVLWYNGTLETHKLLRSLIMATHQLARIQAFSAAEGNAQVDTALRLLNEIASDAMGGHTKDARRKDGSQNGSQNAQTDGTG